VRRAAIAALLLIALALMPVAARGQAAWGVLIESVSFVSSANTPVYPGSAYAELSVEGKLFENATRPVATIYPPRGITPSYGYGLSAGARDAYDSDVLKVREGETAHFVYRLNVDRSVEPGTYLVNMQLYYTDDRGQPKSYSLWFEVTVSPYPEASLKVVEARWSPAGYVSTYGATLLVTVENGGDSAVYYATVELSCPEGLVCRGRTATLTSLSPGQRATLSFGPIDIPEGARAGDYAFLLRVDASMLTKDGVPYSSGTNVSFTARVEPHPSWARQLRVLQAAWGQVAPQPVYPDSLYAQLTVSLVNEGPYPVTSIEASIEPVGAETVVGSSSSATPLDVGGTATLDFYLSVRRGGLLEGRLEATLAIKYVLDLGGGAYLVVRDTAPLSVGLESYPKGSAPGVGVALCEWQNNYPVYPNTSKAVLVVQLSNNLPYSLSGLNATIILPEGFSSGGRGTRTFYYGSPVQPYGSVQLSYPIDVGDVEPGEHKALLVVEYVAQSGGPGKKIVDVHALNLTVSPLGSPVSVVATQWWGGSPDVQKYGATLLVYVRNTGVESLSNPVLFLELPEGVTLATTNESRGAVLPGGPQPYQLPAQPASLEELLRYLASAQAGGQTQPGRAYAKGETVLFAVPLNLMLNSTGTLWAEGRLSFVDQWGTLREAAVEIPIPVLGSSRYVEVRVEGSLDLRSRYSNATLVLRNVGSAEVRNVYVTVAPPSSPVSGGPSSLLLPTPSTHYVEGIPPGGEARLPLTLVFNPLYAQAGYGALPTLLSYGAVPLEVTVSYEDPSGAQRTFKNQIALAVEPFIDVVLTDLKAQLSNGTLKVSGTVVNYGSTTAYRLSITSQVAGQTSVFYVGDVDAGSTNAFRIDHRLPSGERPDAVRLVVSYYNAYNELQQREVLVSVVEAPQPPPAQPSQQGALVSGAGLYALVALVVAFTALAGLLIYRMYRSHMRKLEAAREWRA